MAISDKFIFRKLDSIGVADAEEDREFLKDCFVDVGYMTILRDCGDPRRIVLGRTGSGKTALLQKLKDFESNVIDVPPESLALAYISNSTILKFVSQLGVELDVFFRLLWRHVFTVELIRAHYHIVTEKDSASVFERIKSFFRETKHQKAIKYLETWGKTFWEETDYRILELTRKLEQEISSKIGGEVLGIELGAEAVRRLSDEQKNEVVQRAQHVINTVQIRELSDIIDLLDQVLDDPDKRYYIVIDKLDEDWVDDRLRYKLLRALIETVRDFRKVRHAKLIVALRVDLLERVFRFTRSPGFQEEKYWPAPQNLIHPL